MGVPSGIYGGLLSDMWGTHGWRCIEGARGVSMGDVGTPWGPGCPRGSEGLPHRRHS